MEKDRLEEIKMVHHAGNYAHRLDCRVCWLISRVEELEKLLKSQAPAGEFGPGTKVERAAGIPICCMAPEYRDCLDRVMDEWHKHWEKLPPDIRIANPDDVYQFAYWLLRWSGLVKPAVPYIPFVQVDLTDEEIEKIAKSGPGKLIYVADPVEISTQEVEKVKKTAQEVFHRVEQTLGRALHYPKYADDQANFPGATEKDGVCVGEHVAETIAEEAAKKIADMEFEVRENCRVIVYANEFIEQQKAKIEDLKGLLREFEWYNETYDHQARKRNHWCPVCGGSKEYGHLSGCRLPPALKE